MSSLRNEISFENKEPEFDSNNEKKNESEFK